MTSECESEHHTCDENKCKCLATHFDPHTAECYKFGSTGGNTTILDVNDDKGGATSILNDLMKSVGKLWLIVIILAVLTLIFLALLIMILRRYYLGYCWTHTKEYEPNSDDSPRNVQFSKSSINNKSFRKRSVELDEDEAGDGAGDDTAADRSNLVATSGKKNGALMSESAFIKSNGNDNVNENHYVRVDMRGTGHEEDDDNGRHSPSMPGLQYQRSHHQVLTRPLPSSTSTPV